MAFEFIVALLNTLLPICLQSFIAGSQEHARKQVEKLKYRTLAQVQNADARVYNEKTWN